MALKEVKMDAKPVRPRAAGKAYRVLYVEDEDVNWEVTRAAIEKYCDIRRARDSMSAVLLLSSNEFDVILMDIQLKDSELDGIELTRRLRAGTAGVLESRAALMAGIPIIFVTAYSARYSKESLVTVGGNDLVTKPVDFPKLIASMAALVAKRVAGKAAKIRDIRS